MSNGLQLQHIKMDRDLDLESINKVWCSIDDTMTAQIVVVYKGHYVLVLKLVHLYYMLIPEFGDVISHTREELIQFLRENNCTGFLCVENNHNYDLRQHFP